MKFLLITTHCQESRHSLVFNADLRHSLHGNNDLSDQPLVSELRNVFRRDIHTRQSLSADLLADLLSQSSGLLFYYKPFAEKNQVLLQKNNNIC